MNFFKQIGTAIYGFDIYYKLKNVKTANVVLYFLIFFNLAAIVSFVPIVSQFVSVGGVQGIIDEYVPEFEIIDGELQTDEKIDKVIENQFYLGIDTDKDFVADDAYNFDNAVLADSEKIIVKNNGRIQTMTFSEMNEVFGVLQKSDLYKMAGFLNSIAIIAMFVVYIIMYVLKILVIMFLGSIGLLIAAILKCRLKYMEALKIVVFAETLPILLQIVINLLTVVNISVSGGIVFVAYYIIWILFIFFGVRSVKHSDVGDNGLNNVF